MIYEDVDDDMKISMMRMRITMIRMTITMLIGVGKTACLIACLDK